VEVTTVLALVGSRRLGDGVSVDGALDVGRWGRVLVASDGRVCGRVALKEDVEAKAELLAVAEVGALLRVVLVQSLVGQVANLFSGTGLINERFDVSCWGGCALGLRPELALRVKVSVHGAITRHGTSTIPIVSHLVEVKVFWIQTYPAGWTWQESRFLTTTPPVSTAAAADLVAASWL
jgi:hypothetical protein